MKKTSCAMAVIAFALVLSLGIVIIPNDTRGFLFNAACKIIPKVGIDIDRDHCIKGIAVFFEDASICEGIFGEEFISEYEGEKVQLENPPKMQCLTEIAVEKNNPSLCNKVNGIFIANTKIDCLYEIAAKNNNKEACNMIGDEEQSRMGFQMNKAGCLAQLTNQ